MKWVRCPHPRNVGIWLNVIPNANRLSIPNTLKYIGPTVQTKAVNVTSDVNALQASMANSSIMTKLAIEPLSAKNKEEIQSIVKALLLPCQILLEIEFDIEDTLLSSWPWAR